MTFRWRNRNRWGDNDRNWGPFTYARDGRGYRPLAVMLKSGGDDEDESGDCTLRISGFGHTLISTLPPVIRPHRKKVYPASWDAATVARLGRNWYYDTHSRKYGFTFHRDGGAGTASHLSVYFGVETHDSSTDQRWGCFLPWTDWRHVRRTLFHSDGSVFWQQWDPPRPLFGKARWATWRDANRRRSDSTSEAEKRCPGLAFQIRDFDGEVISAIARLEEREWRSGTGWFQWLSLFRRPMINRYLELDFSSEVGRRKGSWKGGTLSSHSPTEHGQDAEAALRAYCAKNELTFLGSVPVAAV